MKYLKGIEPSGSPVEGRVKPVFGVGAPERVRAWILEPKTRERRAVSRPGVDGGGRGLLGERGEGEGRETYRCDRNWGW